LLSVGRENILPAPLGGPENFKRNALHVGYLSRLLRRRLLLLGHTAHAAPAEHRAKAAKPAGKGEEQQHDRDPGAAKAAADHRQQQAEQAASAAHAAAKATQPAPAFLHFKIGAFLFVVEAHGRILE
jgi:hypothetical protein